jgi:16S rRNA (guanine527-N7)-methyltransferase
MNLAAALAHGVAELQLDVPPPSRSRLLDYLGMLQKWNRVYNLTAVREPRRMLTHHLLDCLSIVTRISGATLLDVGSGGGLPGIPVAIALPRLTVTLLESSHKKSAFLKQAVIELGLHNVEVVCERAESWNPSARFDLVVSRALSDVPEFIHIAGRFVARGGALGVMKGVYPHEELARLPEGWRLAEAAALKVPGLRGERHWLRFEPVGAPL